MWSLSEREGWLRLKAVRQLRENELRRTPNILTQRVYRTRQNQVTVKMDVSNMEDGQIAGLCHFARTYAYIGAIRTDGQTKIVFNENGTSQTRDITDTKYIWFGQVKCLCLEKISGQSLEIILTILKWM